MVPTKLLKKFARWVLRRELASLRLALYMGAKELQHAQSETVMDRQDNARLLASRDRWKFRALSSEGELSLYRTVTLNPISEGTPS